jgi:hypothetical protein
MRTTANLRSVIILLSAPLAAALGKGEFCFFLAPNSAESSNPAATGPIDFGHIGWGFQIPGNTELYQYGATEGGNFGDTWTAQGTKQQMLVAFSEAGKTWGNDYQDYKCMKTDTSAVDAAEKVVQYQQTKANVYDLTKNNCLEQAMNIAEEYAEYDVYWTIVDSVESSQDAEGLIVPNDFWRYVPVEDTKLPGK